MRIDRAVLREIPLELREIFEISSGATREAHSSPDAGVGWHRSLVGVRRGRSAGVFYETTGTAWHVLTRWLLPALVGTEFDDARHLEVVPWLRGHPMARAAVEMAGWDLEAKRRNVSLSDLVGGGVDAVPVGVSIGIQKTDQELLDKIGEYTREGYRKIKIKIKPGRDVEMLHVVREHFPDVPIMADANSAYTLETDLERLAAMDDDDLMMIEQPLSHEDLLDHATLQRCISTPVCLDESIRSVGDARLALHLGSGRIINIKPGRVGGLASSLAIHDECRALAGRSGVGACLSQA